VLTITMPLFTTTPMSTSMPIIAMIENSVPVMKNSQYTPRKENRMLDRIAIGNTSDSKIAAITTRIITSAMSMLMPICAPASSSSRWLWPQSQE
jgi:hypothetical protein